ncbi:MAG TPA: hypothetical protein VIL84_01795 [Devosiaceae bacterium]
MTSKLASLHAGLVARKGEASPALSNPGFSYVDTPRPMPRPAFGNEFEPERRAGAQRAAERPAMQVVPRQVVPREPQRPGPDLKAVAAQAAPDAHHRDNETHHGPYRLTFRLTHDQRRRIRIAAAQKDQSLQQILSDALDNHLDGLCACSLSDCRCLARQETSPN